MARPLQEKSHDGATGTGAGSAFQTGGRATVCLFVVAANLDDANDTLDVQIEVSQDGTNWTPLRDETGTQVGNVSVSEFSDPDGDGDFAAYVTVHGVAADRVRARITSFADAANGDLAVDTYVGATDNSATSHSFRTS